MVILTVPYNGYPRQGVLTPVTAPYAFHEEQFPFLTSPGSKAALNAKDSSTGAHTWVDVVRYRPLKTAVSGMLTLNFSFANCT